MMIMLSAMLKVHITKSVQYLSTYSSQTVKVRVHQLLLLLDIFFYLCLSMSNEVPCTDFVHHLNNNNNESREKQFYSSS